MREAETAGLLRTLARITKGKLPVDRIAVNDRY
jgi:hypothetical protein